MINDDIARTLSIVRQMTQGKHLTLPNGVKIGMADDMTIGVVGTKDDGEDFVFGMSSMDLKQLNELLTKHNIGCAIPDHKNT